MENEEKTIPEIIEEAKADFCDNYCKYPELYGNSSEEYDEMLQDVCSGCPMNRL